jgi:Ser/Thr protein kinase RdoA (MazF antagonist)
MRTLAAAEGPRQAALFTYVPGAGYTPTAANSFRYGQAIAHFHAATDSFAQDRPIWRFEATEMLERPLELLEPWFAAWPDDRAFLIGLAARIRPLLAGLPRTAPLYGLCHGDLNNGNLHLMDDDRWALLDFEYIGYGWRVFDIATFFNNQLNQEGYSTQTRVLLDAFLDGYQSIRLLSPIEITVLPAFVALRQIWLWGISISNQPMVGLGLFEQWIHEISLPTLRAWVDDEL